MSFSCKQAAQLISASMDRRLSFRERLALGFHLLVCGMCRAYRRHLSMLRRLLRDQMNINAPLEDASPMSLSPKARERIGRAIAGGGAGAGAGAGNQP